MNHREGRVYDTVNKKAIFPDATVEWYAHPSVSDVAHGLDGHIGFRCLECARVAIDGMTAVESSSQDYWQNLQLDWQEECDILQSKFDKDVTAHLPFHIPPKLFGSTVIPQCKSCPIPAALPLKPNPPKERMPDRQPITKR